MGASQNKVFLPLLGKPMLLYSIGAFQRARSVSDIVVVAHPNEVTYCRKEILERYQVEPEVAVIPGGATRHQSEECALTYLRPDIEGTRGPRVDLVLFHDGARPLVTAGDIEKLVRVARKRGGALLGTPIEGHELIAQRKADGTVAAVLPATGFWRAQTPQAFEAITLLAAFDQAHADGFLGTDTASTYERLGLTVHMVEGSRENIKMTSPQDLWLGEAILDDR